MDGKDPWTGEEGSTWRLAVGGGTDLLTMGLGGSVKALVRVRDIVRLPAVINIMSNILQEVLENIAPEKLEEIGLSREAIDIAFSLTEEKKYLKAIEILSNLVQAGLVSEDLIKKHVEKVLTEDSFN